MSGRDYSLTGADAAQAAAKGLVNAGWYRPDLPRAQLDALMRRRDGPAIRDTLVWLAALLLSGGAGALLWGSAWAIPCFAVYGVLYGTAGDSRWHETGHGTAFRTAWMNQAVHQLACFMMLREPALWRRSHIRHHSDTIIVGRDPEIAVPRPPDLLGWLLDLFALKSGARSLGVIALHATGRLTADEATFVPPRERPSLVRTARIWLLILAAVVILCMAMSSLLPAVLVGLPTFYGAWLGQIFATTQHAGLAEDVLDHRLNSRTVRMNILFRFLYWNMNHHVEHHLFPMVPFHALPALQDAIRGDCPEPYRGLLHAYREIVPTLWRQRRDPSHHAIRPLPSPPSH